MEEKNANGIMIAAASFIWNIARLFSTRRTGPVTVFGAWTSQ
jgi:hypothetical protein